MDVEMADQSEPEKREVDSGVLSARRLYQHDPLHVLYKDRLHLNTLLILSGVCVYFVLLFPLISQYRDFQPYTSLDDALDLILLSIASIFGTLIYLQLPTVMASVFNTLSKNGVIGPSRLERSGAMSYPSFLRQVVAWVDGWWWSIAAVMLSLGYFLYLIFVLDPQLLNLSPFWLAVQFLLITLPFIYIPLFVLVRILLLIIFINRLFSLFTIQVKPLHPDGSGGMGSLGQILWMCAGALLSFALFIFAFRGHSAPPLPLIEIIVYTIIYLILIVSLMIGWLALPHQAMVQARDAILQPLTNEYQRVLMETIPAVGEETAQIVTGTERLSALKQRYELVRDTFPTWPLQIVEIRRLAVALLLPALIALLPALFALFTKK